MELEDVLVQLREVQYHESMFSKIMHAKTIGELMELDLKPDQLMSYFSAAEELGRMEEEHGLYVRRIAQKLKDAYPVKRRRALFM